MEILFEDNHLIVINKQVADLVQADETGDEVWVTRLRLISRENIKNPERCFWG